MKNEAQKQFVTALNFLLKQEGHGSQAKLSRTLNIDRGYLNNIVNQRTPGSQDKKEKIAGYFGMRYEEMLSLGRQVLSLFSGDISKNFKNLAEEATELVNNPKVKFNSALIYLLNKIDADTLEIIANRNDLDPKILYSMKRGDAYLTLSDNLEEKLALEFNLTHEEMLSLGGWILTGKSEESWYYEHKFNDEQQEHSVIYKPLTESIIVDNKQSQNCIYEKSFFKQDRNMLLITKWIDQQDNPDEYWTFLKMLLKREEPEFKEWLKTNSLYKKK